MAMFNANAQCSMLWVEQLTLDIEQSERSEEWCRCRDLNPGLRGYEPRALTN
jgi:hypothetical protein